MTSTRTADAEFSNAAANARYTRVAIILHWIIAAAIIFMIWSGLTAHEGLEHGSGAEQRSAAELLQTHKAVGLTVLVLSLLRLGWRLAHYTPPLPASMPSWQKLASHATHVLFYLAMIGGPLTGWLLVSINTQYDVTTLWFGLFEVPHLPVASTLPNETKDALYGPASEFHELIALGTIALIVLHVGAALKHHFVDGDAVLARMIPFIKPRYAVLGLPIRRGVSAIRRLASFGVYIAAVVLVVAVAFAAYRAQQMGAPKIIEATTSSMIDVGGDRAEPAAQRWAPDYQQSSVVIETVVNGAPTEITLSWKASIAFGPEDLESSSVDVTFDMSQASTGDANNQTELKKPLWFDVAQHPTARFSAQKFEAGAEEGAYLARGQLTIKGVTKDFDLPFTLKIEGDRAEMAASPTVMRLDYGVGSQSPNPPLEARVAIRIIAEKAAQ